jgi:hypothetical protein
MRESSLLLMSVICLLVSHKRLIKTSVKLQLCSTAVAHGKNSRVVSHLHTVDVSVQRSSSHRQQNASVRAILHCAASQLCRSMLLVVFCSSMLTLC